MPSIGDPNSYGLQSSSGNAAAISPIGTPDSHRRAGGVGRARFVRILKFRGEKAEKRRKHVRSDGRISTKRNRGRADSESRVPNGAAEWVSWKEESLAPRGRGLRRARLD